VHVRNVVAAGAPDASRVLTFGHSGWLWRNSYLLYDRETESLWHHLTGRAMSGPLRGTALRRLPTVLTNWAAWRAEHPRTLVLPRPPHGPRGEPTDVDGYAERTARRTVGYGIDVGDASRLYPPESLAADGLVEEDVGGVPVVVARDAEGAAAHAFDRRVGGRTLSFERDTAGAPPRPVLRERGASRTWSLRSGRPLDPADEPLGRLLGSPWETAAWTLQHPAGTVHPGRPGDPPPSPR